MIKKESLEKAAFPAFSFFWVTAFLIMDEKIPIAAAGLLHFWFQRFSKQKKTDFCLHILISFHPISSTIFQKIRLLSTIFSSNTTQILTTIKTLSFICHTKILNHDLISVEIEKQNLKYFYKILPFSSIDQDQTYSSDEKYS